MSFSYNVMGPGQGSVLIPQDPAPGFLLDNFPGAGAAFSLRKLSSNTTNVIRVRRSSDNAEQDFTAQEVVNGSLESFCGSEDGFVAVWYDQSPEGLNAEQTEASKQPKIVNSGQVITLNGKPSIFLERTAEFQGAKLEIPNSKDKFNYLHNGTKCNVVFTGSYSQGGPIFGNIIFSGVGFVNFADNFVIGARNDNEIIILVTAGGPVKNNQSLIFYDIDADNSNAGLRARTSVNQGNFIGGNQNTAQPTQNDAKLNMQLGVISDFSIGQQSQAISAKYQELIFFNSNKLPQKSNIENNTNSFYGIY